jgi:hypothetical protein
MGMALTTAGLISVALGAGHEALGLVWVLPDLKQQRLRSTPFGPPALTEAMIRVTWHIVTIFAVASGGLLSTLAWAPDADPMTVLLRWFAAMWIGATAIALSIARPRLRSLVRLPVPVLFVSVAVLCWTAST